MSRLKGYNRDTLKSDAIAGVTVALVLMPQSMAYAQLADLPTYYGLYAALLPPVVAAIFGSSQQLSTGPVAVVSLMTSASLAPLAPAGSEGFIAYAVLLALVVGVFQLALGLLRLGMVVNFISHPVVNGFSNAAALIIASSQLAKLLGVQVDKSEHYYQTIARVAHAAISHTHWPTLAMGLLAIAIMVVMKRLRPASPYVLAAVVITTVLSWAVGFENNLKPPLSAMADPAVRRTIVEYNHAVKKALAHHHQSLGLRRRAAKLKPRTMAYLELTQDAQKEKLLSDQFHQQASAARHRLRSFYLVSVKTTAGRVFYLQDKAPPGQKTGPERWRFKVGNAPLDLQALPLAAGGEVVGWVKPGLPPFGLPTLELAVLPHLFTYAVIISLLGFTEAISIAKAMAAKTGQTLDPNQELIGQGLGNIAGSLSMSYPVSGSFSRSAVNLQAGARTSLSSLFTSLTVAVSLLFLTPLLYHLPQSVLAAVIMMAVVGLINIHGIVHAWKAQRHDGIIAVLTFLTTLAFAPHLDRGIVLGVSLSLLVFLYKSMRPRVAELALGEDHAFHDASQYHLERCDRIAVIRFDGPLFFASANYLETQIALKRKSMPSLRHILLVCDGIGEMDASGEEALSLIVDRLRAAGIGISFSGVHHNMLEVIKRTGLMAKIGEDNFYPTVNEAIAHIHHDAHRDVGTDIVCPLLAICHTEQNTDRELH